VRITPCEVSVEMLQNRNREYRIISVFPPIGVVYKFLGDVSHSEAPDWAAGPDYIVATWATSAPDLLPFKRALRRQSSTKIAKLC
jgi:hypothetical protein